MDRAPFVAVDRCGDEGRSNNFNAKQLKSGEAMIRITIALAAVAGFIGIAVQPAMSANVKITPLGSYDGEFCAADRAMIFEDPDGTRIL